MSIISLLARRWSYGVFLGVASACLSACTAHSGSQYVPTVDGPQGATYYSDLSDCQALARYSRGNSNDINETLAVRSGTDALADAIDTRGGSSGAGAIAGILLGSAYNASGAKTEKRAQEKNVMISCMAGRGYKIVE